MAKFYVYALISSLGNETFYIGKGTGDRMNAHIRIAKGKTDSMNRLKNPKLYNKIAKLLNEGHNVLAKVLYTSDVETDCLNKEIELIEQIGLDNLCNLTLGGEGTSGYKLSEETRQKMRNAKLGVKRTDLAKQKISEGKKGKPGNTAFWKGKEIPEDVKEKMSIAKKGRKSGPISDKRRQAIKEGIAKRKTIKL